MQLKRVKKISMLFVLLITVLAIVSTSGVGITAKAGTEKAANSTSITVIGFSDYHAHAVPFYSEGAQNQAGIARGIAFLKAERKADPNVLVLSGGDMFNIGSPTWSDEYKCTEWVWLNGLVDAMAIGNHEFDYGQDVFKQCAASVKFPFVSANFVDKDGKPLLQVDGKPYLVKDINGIKVGAFALGDSDFDKLIKKANMPDGAKFADRVATAKQIVDTLRNVEKVNVVILFGHAYRESDTALAQAVPGIDLILGTHSHYQSELIKLPNTETWFISPFQYLTYFSKVQITFADGKLSDVKGQLVKMDEKQPEDPEIAKQVAQMQKDLEAKHPDRFKVLGNAAVEMSDHNISTDETILGNWAMEVVRAAAGTHVFMSTSSSFRAAIPPGPITVEAFFTAIPYKNAIVTVDMTGQQLTDLLNIAVSKRGSDSFIQESGVRFKMADGKATDIQILKDPADPKAGYEPLDPAKTYKVGTTDFQATISAVYKDAVAKGANLTNTKRDIGQLLTDAIQSSGTITGALDGRMGTEPGASSTESATETMDMSDTATMAATQP